MVGGTAEFVAMTGIKYFFPSVVLFALGACLILLPEPSLNFTLPSPTGRVGGEVRAAATFQTDTLQTLNFAKPLAPDAQILSPMDLQTIRLTGVFWNGPRASAILQLPDGSLQTVKTGNVVAGWTVQHIGARNIILKRQHEVVEKRLFAIDRLPSPRPEGTSLLPEAPNNRSGEAAPAPSLPPPTPPIPSP